MANGKTPRASKETRQADAFIQFSDRFIKWAQSKQQLLVAVLVGIVLAGTAFGAYTWVQQSREEDGQKAYFAAEKAYVELKEKRSLAKDEFEAAQKDQKDNSAIVKGEFFPTGDLSSDYGKSIDQFKQVIKSHKGTRAALLSALNIGRIYIDYGLFNEAERELSELIGSNHKSGLVAGLLSFQQGLIAEANGKCDQALSHWDATKSNPDTVFLSPNVLVKQAICHEKSNNLDKAKELYNKVVEEFGETAAGKSARTYLRLLESKSTQEG